MGELNKKANGEYTVMLVNIERDLNKTKAENFGNKNEIGDILHFFGQAPKEIGLKYIPHKTLIGVDGKIVQNGTWDLSKATEYLKKAIEDGKAAAEAPAEAAAEEPEPKKAEMGTDL